MESKSIEETVKLIRNVYLLFCFSNDELDIEEDENEDYDNELEPESEVDNSYVHFCEGCEDQTLYNDKKLIEHKYGPVCLNDLCMENLIEYYINH